MQGGLYMKINYKKGDEEAKAIKETGKIVNEEESKEECREKNIKIGMEVEKEHDDLTKGDPKKIRMIVDAHIKEDPKYYEKLKKMEEDDEEEDEKEKED